MEEVIKKVLIIIATCFFIQTNHALSGPVKRDPIVTALQQGNLVYLKEMNKKLVNPKNQWFVELAAGSGKVGVVKYLLQLGYKIKCPLKKCFVLAYGIDSESPEMVSFLIEKGANPNSTAQGFPMLYRAIFSRNSDIVKTIAKKTKDIHQVGCNPKTKRIYCSFGRGKGLPGESPLHAAVRFGNKDIIKILLEAGANSKSKGAMRKSPYDCLLYTSPSPRDATLSRMPSSA